MPCSNPSSAPQILELNCIVFGDSPHQVFGVDIAQNEKVSALRMSIKKQKPRTLPDAPDLILFKVDLPASRYRELPLGDFKDEILKCLPAEYLHGADRLHKIFPSGSPEDDGGLHIVAVCPRDIHILIAHDQKNADLFKDFDVDEAEEDNVDDGAREDNATGGANGPSVFAADDVGAILKEMGYRINFILAEHPLVAAVSNVADDSKTGFLKFVRGSKEISILQHLSAIDSPQNHTIAGVRFWPVDGGHVISMPSAGSQLTKLREPSEQLWPVARQLFEAVDSMHQHGVAHLDLKPANALIPPAGRRLSIIDFDASVRVKGVNTMFRGVVGTPGYIPPEVRARSKFSAVRADLWPRGKIIDELRGLCCPSQDRDVLLDIAQELMDDTPAKRPMMADVLERMDEEEACGNAGSEHLRSSNSSWEGFPWGEEFRNHIGLVI